MIGKLKRVSLREVWPNEARDFTPWLQANIDMLSEAIDITLANAESEQPAGHFMSGLQSSAGSIRLAPIHGAPLCRPATSSPVGRWI